MNVVEIKQMRTEKAKRQVLKWKLKGNLKRGCGINYLNLIICILRDALTTNLKWISWKSAQSSAFVFKWILFFKQNNGLSDANLNCTGFTVDWMNGKNTLNCIISGIDLNVLYVVQEFSFVCYNYFCIFLWQYGVEMRAEKAVEPDSIDICLEHTSNVGSNWNGVKWTNLRLNQTVCSSSRHILTA